MTTSAPFDTLPDTLPVRGLLDLSSQAALVTGASGGIGRVIALRLAEAGAEVMLHYHQNRSAVLELEAEIHKIGARCRIVQADLTRQIEVDDLFTNLATKGIKLDILVNNAAIQPVVSLPEMRLGDWQQMLQANLDSVFLTTRAAAITMAESRKANHGNKPLRTGSIINIASIEGHDPSRGHGHYATSKAGLLMFTRAAALEFAPQVRVNAISPGLIQRSGLEEDWPDGVARWLHKNPLGRLGNPEDVANAALFLASPGAGWISGSDLIVDGGMSANPRW